jgi:predicted RNA-binding Zn-ribbon protein involved in translation (DUF1610 family)
MSNARMTVQVKPEAIRVKYRCPSCKTSALRRMSEARFNANTLTFSCDCGCDVEVALSRAA